jgi:putative transposase
MVSNEKESFYGRANRSNTEGVGGWYQQRRHLQETRNLGSNLLQVASQVWRHASERREKDEVAGRREPNAQAPSWSKGTGHHCPESCACKKVVTVPQKKEAVELMKETGMSERKACDLIELNRSTKRHLSQAADNAVLVEAIRKIADERRRFGYRRIHAQIRQKLGLVVNHKKVYRLYSEANLKLRRKKRKKRYEQRAPMPVPAMPNDRWSLDFVSDTLFSGRRFRTLNVVDDHTRECLGIDVAYSLPAQRVTRALDRMIWWYGKPTIIVSDNGPEFRSKHVDKWAKKQGITWHFIDPGKPMQNAFVESFNGKFRDECLNESWFSSLEEAQDCTEKWRNDYNTERPHSSLNYRTPAELRQTALPKAV